MQVKLAGYNVDADVLGAVLSEPWEFNRLNPETIAAAYARISRSSKSVSELRVEAGNELEKARESNTTIAFAYGHSSIMEHAELNFDIIGVSRLLVEEIEHHRLVSFLEKSQRYTVVKDGPNLPSEVRELGFEKEFKDLADLQASTYETLRKGIIAFLKAEGMDPEYSDRVKTAAKEDARYVTSLATPTQLGMTINARNLNLMIERLANHPLAEAHDLSNQLYRAAQSIIPSLVRMPRNLPCGPSETDTRAAGVASPDTTFIAGTAVGESIVLASLLFSSGDLSWDQCMRKVLKSNVNEKVDIMSRHLGCLESWDPVPRAFEMTSIAIEASLSASCFAQLKRHRMATIIKQPYNPKLGFTEPLLVQDANMSEAFSEVMKRSGDLYTKVYKCNPHAAEYVLTQAHRRRCIISMNLRELHAFAKLRLDYHAQWDIRKLAETIVRLAKQQYPIITMMVCGKDKFETSKERLQSYNK